MNQRYMFLPLSRREQREHEQVLLEELDIQHWFVITWCNALNAEVALSTQ